MPNKILVNLNSIFIKLTRIRKCDIINYFFYNDAKKMYIIIIKYF